jgi:hypothetical protein
MHGGFVIDCDTDGSHCGGGGLAGAAWEFFQKHPFGVSQNYANKVALRLRGPAPDAPRGTVMKRFTSSILRAARSDEPQAH